MRGGRPGPQAPNLDKPSNFRNAAKSLANSTKQSLHMSTSHTLFNLKTDD